MDGTPTAEARGEEYAASTTVIADSGDLLLHVSHELESKNIQRYSFRVDTTKLRQSSRFFDRLLSGQFVEAKRVAERLDHLQRQYDAIGDAPLSELPSITVKDIGRVSVSKSVRPLMTDFLNALHGCDMEGKASMIPNISNLTVVADRFDALGYFAEYVRKRKLLRATKDTPEPKLSEERIRQKLYVGVLLSHEAWVTSTSLRIIIRGSESWTNGNEDFNRACWWDLPQGLEGKSCALVVLNQCLISRAEELQYRRECILDTLGSLQTHFLELYTSRERQCKLGYDSSPQCDAFQLGEMMRFFTRGNLVRVQSIIYDVDASHHIHTGDIYHIINTLRQCPSYQIDNNHTHCGLRSRLIPILDSIELAISDVGICAECWEHRRDSYAWSRSKRLPIWRRLGPHGSRSSGRKGACRADHPVRDMFTAVLRDWTARDTYSEEVHRDHLSSGMKLVR